MTRAPREISRQTETGPAPLSFGQQRLWFLDQLRPNHSAYNMTQVLRLTGVLEVPALERAVNEIRRRHDVLRANFEFVADQPMQIIAPFQPIPLTEVDCSGFPNDQRQRACQEAIDNYSRRPFNLATEPLMRTALVRLHTTEHLLVVVIHHIVSDGWSMGVLVQESTLYAGVLAGKRHRFPSCQFNTAITPDGSANGSRAQCSRRSCPIGKHFFTAASPLLTYPPIALVGVTTRPRSRASRTCCPVM
jgi:hypothetical protein